MELQQLQLQQQMQAFKAEIEKLLKQGKTLREVSQYTYQQREAGRNIPYLGVSNRDDKTKQITTLTAQPTVKQQELYEFFNKRAKGSALPEYTFTVDFLTGVEFKHRLNKILFELL